jgi:hypothetical protein
MAQPKAPPKRKTIKRKPREIILEELDPFEKYGNSSPHNTTHEIRSKIEDGNRNLEAVVDAIHAIDQFHLTNPRPDKTPLIDLLMSRGTTKEENELLADLIDRVVLKWGVGARKLPAYLIADDHHHMLNARAYVQELRASGLSRPKAIERVSEDLNIPYSKLDAVCRGQARFIRATNKRKKTNKAKKAKKRK